MSSEVKKSSSPVVAIKSFKDRICILHILLGFFAHIENRTILTCTEDILVTRSATDEYTQNTRKLPDAASLGIADIASTGAKSALAAPKST